jgi:hypothetical protein
MVTKAGPKLLQLEINNRKITGKAIFFIMSFLI